jgi:ABC-2 type transport system permease protein
VNTRPLLLPAVSLWWRDVVRFLRQRNRIIGALATPVVFWLLLGAGFSGSFVPPGSSEPVSYFVYYFSGTVVLIMLFTAIFSTISVIEDRREGFLQGVLVSPASPCAIVLGKFAGGTTLATLQGLIFCALAPFAGIPLGFQNILPVLVAFLLTGFAMTGLGFIVAWPMESTQGFHAVMNLFLMPLWMLSGALFPAAPGSWTAWILALNPVTYSVAAVRHALSSDPFAALPGSPSLLFSLVITAAFGALLFLVGLGIVIRRPYPAARLSKKR